MRQNYILRAEKVSKATIDAYPALWRHVTEEILAHLPSGIDDAAGDKRQTRFMTYGRLFAPVPERVFSELTTGIHSMANDYIRLATTTPTPGMLVTDMPLPLNTNLTVHAMLVWCSKELDRRVCNLDQGRNQSSGLEFLSIYFKEACKALSANPKSRSINPLLPDVQKIMTQYAWAFLAQTLS